MLRCFDELANRFEGGFVGGDALDKAAEELRVALSHLGSTVSAVLSDSYTSTYVGALEDLAGPNPKLTDRLLEIERKDIESKGRAELA